jgi:hypothetical protein
MRLNSVTGTIENGFVYVPTEADWLACYLHELTSFPNGKHDDQADSTSQALDWAKTAIFSLPLIEYYRNEAIRLASGAVDARGLAGNGLWDCAGLPAM